MSLLEEYELLRRVPFFAEIEPAKLKLLAFMSERVGFDDGKLLCRQGDPADAAYLIIDGEVDIVLEGSAGPLTVATLGKNEIVAEMAILCDVPRNATVRAKDRLVIPVLEDSLAASQVAARRRTRKASPPKKRKSSR